MASPKLSIERTVGFQGAWEDDVPEGLYRQPEVLHLTGISRRQYVVWIERGLLGEKRRQEKPGSGMARVWTKEELIRFIEIRDAYHMAAVILREAGIPFDYVGGNGPLVREAKR